MDAARWNRIEELLQGALDCEPHQRDAFLTAACGSDAALRRELEALLAHEANESFLNRRPPLELLRTHEELTGRTISHYRIAAKIGAGGMGEVYEAHDENLQRTVALKVLPEEFLGDEERVRRFEQEAFAASRLNHPNIITIFEVLHAEGAHLIATERIDGKTVRELLNESRFGTDRALDVAIQVAEALRAAHTAWIIHRDVKPENVMVRADGLVKVLDFGIAKRNDEQQIPSPRTGGERVAEGRVRGANLTAAGAILGTANYMSPEQSRGEALDGRTDLYSLGLVLHEMLTGERPPKGKLDAAPKDLQRIVRKLLRENRDERYSTAVELLDELRRAKRSRESRTARRMIGIGVLAVIVAIAVAAIAAVLSIQETWDERVLRDGHVAAARQAVFSPDGTKVVSCGEDGQVIVWDFARRQRIATLAGKTAHKVAWSPDGRWIAAGAIDGTVTIWDATRFTRVHALRAARSEIGALAFSHDSTVLAIGDMDTSSLYDTTRWQRVGGWARGAYHAALAFTADGRFVIGTNGLVVHDRARGATTRDQDRGANWVAISPDESKIAAIETHGQVAFYRFDRGSDAKLELLEWSQAHQDHGRTAAWSPDGKLIATGAEDILLWDAATRRRVARFEYSSIVWSTAFSPDGRWLLSSHGDGAILVWSVAERRRVASFSGHSGAVRAIAISHDGRRIASAGEDRSIALWDLASGRKERVLPGHDTRVTGVAFSRDGTLLASVDQLGGTILWDLASAEPVVSFERRPRDASYCVKISPDGRFLAATRAIHTIGGREVRDFTAVAELGQIYGNDYARDGRWLATASTGQGSLVLWDAATYRMLDRARVGGDIRLIAVSASADAKRLVTGEDQGAIRLWSAGPLRQEAILGRHAARVKSVAFAPDGKTAASAGDDGIIALWDVRRRKLLTRIGTHASPVYAIAFTPDGRHLVSGEHDRSVRVYTRRRTLWGWEWDSSS
jgi:eukaryotic-like serine/threonine-protein kinase